MPDTAHRLSSRKFLVILSGQVANTALLVGGYLSEGNFVTLTMFLLGGYLAGNVAQHVWEPKHVQISSTQEGPDPLGGGRGGRSTRSVTLLDVPAGEGQREPGTDEGAREISQRTGEVDR